MFMSMELIFDFGFLDLGVLGVSDFVFVFGIFLIIGGVFFGVGVVVFRWRLVGNDGGVLFFVRVFVIVVKGFILILGLIWFLNVFINCGIIFVICFIILVIFVVVLIFLLSMWFSIFLID